MKTLEDALRSYKNLEVDEVFVINTDQLSLELKSNPDFKELIDQALTDHMDKYVIYRGSTAEAKAASRVLVGSVLGALLQAGLTIGEDMNAPEMPTL